MPSINVRGLDVYYHDEGSGTPVILVHCSSASHKEWLPLMAKLRGGYRIIAPDLTGYGKSARWPKGRAFDGTEDFEILQRLSQLSREPAHFVGHSYGAAVVLGAGRQLGTMVRSAVLIEPVAFQLLNRPGFEDEWSTIQRLTQTVARYMAVGRPQRAAAAYMGFWIGKLRWWFTPRAIKRSIHDTMEKSAVEFGLIEKAAVDPAAFRSFSPPTRLVYGENTTAPAKAVIRIMSDMLPECDVASIKGAGHMSPFTHADDVNALILQHIAAH